MNFFLQLKNAHSFSFFLGAMFLFFLKCFFFVFGGRVALVLLCFSRLVFITIAIKCFLKNVFSPGFFQQNSLIFFYFSFETLYLLIFGSLFSITRGSKLSFAIV